MGVLQSSIACTAVGDKPGHLLGLIEGIVVILLQLLHLRIVILPFLVGCHNSAVTSERQCMKVYTVHLMKLTNECYTPVGGRPVDGIGNFDILRVIWTFQVVHHCDLLMIAGPAYARGYVVILVEYHIGHAG